MIHIFYFIGILFIIYECYCLVNISKRVEQTYKFTELLKSSKGQSWDDMDGEYKNLLLTKGCSSIIFLLWFFVGLTTFNWVIFGVFILIQFLIMQPIMKRVKYTVFYLYFYFLNTLIGLSLGLFVVINHYHLRIDLQPYVVDLFNLIFN